MDTQEILVPKDLEEYIIRMRRHFHRNPELSFKEHKTAERIMEELKSFGLQPRRIGQTGVIADISGSGSGRTSALVEGRQGRPPGKRRDGP